MGLRNLLAVLAIAGAGFIDAAGAAAADVFDQFGQSPSLKTLLETKPRFEWKGDGPADIKNAEIVYTAEFRYGGKDRMRLYEIFTFLQREVRTTALVTSDFTLHSFTRAKVQDRDPQGYVSGNRGLAVELYCKNESRCFQQSMTILQTRSDGTTRLIEDNERKWETVELRLPDQGAAQQVAYALSDLAEMVSFVKD